MGKSAESQLLAKSIFASSLQNSVDYGRITMVIQDFSSPVTSVNLKKKKKKTTFFHSSVQCKNSF